MEIKRAKIVGFGLGKKVDEESTISEVLGGDNGIGHAMTCSFDSDFKEEMMNGPNKSISIVYRLLDSFSKNAFFPSSDILGRISIKSSQNPI
ncbi:hypothetical protein IEQ34_004273 [Dendrobium chrysotoxum]|uniref:Uncharacterized protein n=1 Tax=Dendrobium chrysotoxum TaxID=161865 RepID=A0AAV7HFW2_DENCH|nr:hypothetical protein IEQ34_004273 [Dendrobium chrysotoxum]